MAGISLIPFCLDLAFDIELVVIQAAPVRSDPEIVAHVCCTQSLFTGHQSLIELLPVSGTDDLFLRLPENFHHAVRQIADSTGVRLLNEKISWLRMFKGKGNQFDCLVKVHQETGHVGICNGDRCLALDLVDEKRNETSSAAHNIAVSGTGQDRTAPLKRLLGPGGDNLFPYRFGHAHGIDRISRLIGGKEHNALDPVLYRCRDHIIGADYIGTHRLHREELTGRHLFQCRCMEYIIRPIHDIPHGFDAADIPHIKLDLACMIRVPGLQNVPHHILLLFISADNPDFSDLGGQEMFKDC